MKYAIEIEEAPFCNGHVITEDGVVVHEEKGIMLYRVKGIPYIAFTAEELEKLERLE